MGYKYKSENIKIADGSRIGRNFNPEKEVVSKITVEITHDQNYNETYIIILK